MEEYYKLCYVDGNKAWFTNNFIKQWGDDWNDSPYECNAGEPYNSWSELLEDNKDVFKRKWKNHKIKHKTLYFEVNDWSEKQPCDMGRYSVEDINKQKVPWISTDDFAIFAGITYENFIDIIEKHDGKIYVSRPDDGNLQST